MRRPRHEIEASVPSRTAPQRGAQNSRPQIRRQLERICESLGVDYDDLVELHIRNGFATAIIYDRNSDGELYRDDLDRLALRQLQAPIDTTTFLGDERDI